MALSKLMRQRGAGHGATIRRKCRNAAVFLKSRKKAPLSRADSGAKLRGETTPHGEAVVELTPHHCSSKKLLWNVDGELDRHQKSGVTFVVPPRAPPLLHGAPEEPRRFPAPRLFVSRVY